MSKDIIIMTSESETTLSELEGKSFQIHVLPNGKLRLYPLSFVKPYVDLDCPIILAGERCGKPAGHPGKHTWANGD